MFLQIIFKFNENLLIKDVIKPKNPLLIREPAPLDPETLKIQKLVIYYFPRKLKNLESQIKIRRRKFGQFQKKKKAWQ